MALGLSWSFHEGGMNPFKVLLCIKHSAMVVTGAGTFQCRATKAQVFPR
jgi:hypothetical protein